MFIKNIIELGGSTLISRYNMSLSALLSTVYPEENWDFEPKDNQRAMVNQIAQKLGIKEMSDWYNVTNKVNISFCVFFLFIKRNSLQMEERLRYKCLMGLCFNYYHLCFQNTSG